ncbi:MAG: SIS domain-containing protein [Candidatus Aenigmarchaeota archaeon]|nr:SIS domain-containing protein [Candidatus Aenigmarchaeota archaeon]
MYSFEELPKAYKSLCDLVCELDLEEEKFSFLKEELRKHKNKRIICVGVGRTGYVAEIFSSYLRNLGYNSFDPNTIPYKLTSSDLILLFSGSGTSELPKEVGRIGRKVGAKIISFTSYPTSEIGLLSDYVINIKGRTKVDVSTERLGKVIIGESDSPLTPLGTLFELRLLLTLMSFVGSIQEGKAKDIYLKLCESIREFSPNQKEFENLYNITPKPRSLHNPLSGKTVVVGEGFSGIVGKFFVTRFRHCAKENDERDVSFYTDAGNVSVREKDLLLIISGSGREKFYRYASIAKEKGANIGIITSNKNKELAKIADALVLIPGRIEENLDGLITSYYPTDPKKSIFELRTLFSLEAYLYIITRIEKISEEEMKIKHSDFT